jgi:hypothetical protein
VFLYFFIKAAEIALARGVGKRAGGEIFTGCKYIGGLGGDVIGPDDGVFGVDFEEDLLVLIVAED